MENDLWSIPIICHCSCRGLGAVTFYVWFPGGFHQLLNISPKGVSIKPQPIHMLNQGPKA